jgi:hypothetical protein
MEEVMEYPSETFRIIVKENHEMRRLLWAIVRQEDGAIEDAQAFLTDSASS